jgi:hypothetical protein
MVKMTMKKAGPFIKVLTFIPRHGKGRGVITPPPIRFHRVELNYLGPGITLPSTFTRISVPRC